MSRVRAAGWPWRVPVGRRQERRSARARPIIRSCSAARRVRVDAVHQEREGDASPPAVSGSSRPAPETASSVPVLARQRSRATLRAHPVVQRAAAAGDRAARPRTPGRRLVRHALEQPDDLPRRRAVGAREAGAVGDPRAQAEAAPSSAHDGGARARSCRLRRTSAPSALISVSAMKLSDGTLVQADQRRPSCGESRSASGSAVRGVAGPARRGARRSRRRGARSARANASRGEARRAALPVRAARGRCGRG